MQLQVACTNLKVHIMISLDKTVWHSECNRVKKYAHQFRMLIILSCLFNAYVCKWHLTIKNFCQLIVETGGCRLQQFTYGFASDTGYIEPLEINIRASVFVQCIIILPCSKVVVLSASWSDHRDVRRRPTGEYGKNPTEQKDLGILPSRYRRTNVYYIVRITLVTLIAVGGYGLFRYFWRQDFFSQRFGSNGDVLVGSCGRPRELCMWPYIPEAKLLHIVLVLHLICCAGFHISAS